MKHKRKKKSAPGSKPVETSLQPFPTVSSEKLVISFQNWVNSLDWEELQAAMEFGLASSGSEVFDQNSGNYCESNNSFVLSEDEWKLLQDMISMQPCPPVPIHPRATGLVNRASTAITDGRNPESIRLRHRLEKPRLFQWVTRVEDDPIAALPAELRHLLPKQRVKPSKKAAKSFAGISKKFDVLARKFVMPDGTRLSIGCTKEQQLADESILFGTFMCCNTNNDSQLSRCCFDVQRLNTALRLSVICDQPKRHDDNKLQKRTILKILRIASRGNFGNQPLYFQHSKSSNQNTFGSINMSQNSYQMAPWFNPEERWFSLSMYLANCFEVSLWASFYKHRQRQQSQNVPSRIPRFSTPSCDDIILFQAISDVTKQIVQMETETIDTRFLARDGILWALLMDRSYDKQKQMKSTNALLPWNSIAKTEVNASESETFELWLCPLVEFNAPVENWRNLVRRRAQKLMAKKVEISLLQELLQNEEKNNHSDETHKIVNTTSKGKGNFPQHLGGTKAVNNGRKKLAKTRNKTQTQQSNQQQPAPKLHEHEPQSKVQDVVTDVDQSSTSSDDSVSAKQNGKNGLLYEFPTNNASSRERNRNIVMALSMLDEILNQAFDRVGLGKLKSGTDDEGAELATEESQFQVIGPNGTIPKPTAKASNSDVERDVPVLNSSKNLNAESRKDNSAGVSTRAPISSSSMSERAVSQALTSTTQPTCLSTKRGSSVPSVNADAKEPITNENVSRANTGSNNFHSDYPQPTPIPEYVPNNVNDIDWQENSEWNTQYNYDPFLAENSMDTIRRSNLYPIAPAYGSLSNQLFQRQGLPLGYFSAANCPWQTGATDNHGLMDTWEHERTDYFHRDESILTEFFQSQEDKIGLRNQEEYIMASSTTASIASSTKKDAQFETGDDLAPSFLDDEMIPEIGSKITPVCRTEVAGPATPVADEKISEKHIVNDETGTTPNQDKMEHVNSDNKNFAPDTPLCSKNEEDELLDLESPVPPKTPPPTLSPILVSLADLSDMKKDVIEKSATYDDLNLPSFRSSGSDPTTTAPNSPSNQKGAARLVSSLSRENLRSVLSEEKGRDRAKEQRSKKTSATFRPTAKSDAGTPKAGPAATYSTQTRDDVDIKVRGTPPTKRSTDALSTYRNVAKRAVASRDDQDIKTAVTREAPLRFPSYKSVAARGQVSLNNASSSSIRTTHSETARKPLHNFVVESVSAIPKEKDFSTQSETALEEQDGYQNWHESRRSQTNEDADNNTVTKDGSTTITSALSQREPEEVAMLREERNSYRDMCLTLGAEVAKLKNLLATQTNSAMRPSMEYIPGYGQFPAHNAAFFDPDSVSRHAFRIPPTSRTLAAMSDAGYRGEHESLASEDDVNTAKQAAENQRQQSSGITVTGSDASLDHASSHNVIHMPFIGIKSTRDVLDPVSLNGMQSRLTKDILHFLDSIDSQLRKQDPKKRAAVERMSRLVNALWPRAQVKLYGSHVTGLCVPSSDLDFVVCLPAVHKNAVAVAAGALEGRNAINETSQKLLARRLKGESWIDPRSMKLIERTVVPVIKVSTKDTKAKTLQLDITFDAPGHHGLSAIDMVTHIMGELPMARPIVIVLKQFLNDRGLLTAYTGGLSSYCLFLMVARYLQEQPSSWGDCGALLMGFLDFYGNCFDPRSTGISVRRRLYFERPNYAALRHQTAWNPVSQPQQTPPPPPPPPPPPTTVGDRNFYRRNSFNDRGSVDGVRGGTTRSSRSQAFQGNAASTQTFNQSQNSNGIVMDQNSFEHGMPYTFDPLFVEDPLSDANNVGRNAFRIFQVQRAFSDAHRALVAALEWDMHSAGELHETNEYPLLKCLLQSEDTVFDL